MSEVSKIEQQLVDVGASDDAQADARADGRVAPRVTLFIRSAKLICGDGEFVCVIRDVSATGVSLRAFHPIPDKGKMTLQMQSGDRYRVELMWNRENEAGFRFVSEVDLTRFIAEDGPLPKRALRFDLNLPVKVCVLGKELDATLSNLSQQGAALECGTQLAISQPVRIKSQLLPDVVAKVRWRRDDCYGIVLENTFRLEDFARLIESLHVTATTLGAGASGPAAQLRIRN